MADPNFPQEILLEIFSYLPTKSVGKFRCLSKTWNSDLSTSQFIKLHQKRKPYQQNLLLLTPRQPIHFVTLPVKNNGIYSKEITQLGNRWVDMAGSCNGLVLLVSSGYEYNGDMFVVNPITRQCFCIPEPSSVKRKRDIEVSKNCSFVYDNSCDDYKVVLRTCRVSEPNECITGCNVYCLKTRVWKNVDYTVDFGQGNVVRCREWMAFVNGAVHWFIGWNEVFGIRAFDLATESLCDMKLPKGLDKNQDFDGLDENVDLYGLVVLRGCLAIIDCVDNGSTNVWLMNEYGVRDSWVRLHINVDVSLGRDIMPLCFVGDEEMLCVADRRRLFVYDFKEGMRKGMVGGETPVSFTNWVVFEESLAAPADDCRVLRQ